MANSVGDYQREFGLARLQKAQSSENATINLPLPGISRFS
jgi:hypothetical protein